MLWRRYDFVEMKLRVPIALLFFATSALLSGVYTGAPGDVCTVGAAGTVRHLADGRWDVADLSPEWQR